MQNPYSLVFGKEPNSLIERSLQTDEIIESFCAKNPDYQVCMLTGVRGSGKTVSLTTIANKLKAMPEWIIVELSIERNLLVQLAAELSKDNSIRNILSSSKFNVTAFGFGVELGNEKQISDVAVELGEMLNELTRAGKKILVCIDEVVVNQNIREFASQFQIYMRQNYNVFLLMTGLYENIYELQNQKTLTFLYRAPKIELKPLSIPMICAHYKKIFNLSDGEALAMAKYTNGYPFAFQLLGYLCFKNNANYKNVIDEYNAYLYEYVYEKIWTELSGLDRQVAEAMAKSNKTKIEDIRKLLQMPSNKFSMYRSRLLRKGIVAAAQYGHIDFVLPNFKEFVLRVS